MELLGAECKDAILWKDVHFSYSAEREVLKGISFQIKKGKWWLLQVVQEKEKYHCQVTVWSVSQRKRFLSAFWKRRGAMVAAGMERLLFRGIPECVSFTAECCRECGVRKGRSCERRN